MSTQPHRTRHNLEAALAGESMAHIKYRWFARLCRAQGDEATARLFEATAEQEVQHAWGHLELLMAGQALTPTERVGAQIVLEVGLGLHFGGIDAELLGNDRAHFLEDRFLGHGRCVRGRILRVAPSGPPLL